MPEAVIVAAARSPIGRAVKGSLKDIRPDDMAAQMVAAALRQVPEVAFDEIDDLMLGCGEPAGEAGFNIARVVAILAGLHQVPGTTVNRYCGSSLQTTRMALHAIRAGEGEVFIAAGVEAVSRFGRGTADDVSGAGNGAFGPAAERTARIAAGELPWTDPRDEGLLPDVYIAMGETAENVAAARRVSRREQDEFALRSQQLTQEARSRGFWDLDITPIELPDGTLVAHDDSPRPGTDLAALSGLGPVFRNAGTVTAGNCCPLNDGAAALIVMSDDRARDLGLAPLARIVSSGVSALSPELMGLGPVEASRRAMAQAGMTMADIDLVEINEAFAAQVIPCTQDLKIDQEKVNVNGGAIAIGHPFGMTGARLITTLIHSLAARDKQTGLATMCVAGGQGMAMVIERLG